MRGERKREGERGRGGEGRDRQRVGRGGRDTEREGPRRWRERTGSLEVWVTNKLLFISVQSQVK